jgi:O-antigen/teichoic acid export membrane protein
VISGVHFFHTVLVGFVLSAGILFVHGFVPAFSASHPLFYIIFINLAIANIANSFKLCMNGLEAYRRLALLTIISNLVRFVLVLAIYMNGHFDLLHVILVYIATSIVEFFVGYFLLSQVLKAKVRILLNRMEYRYFVLESLPQLGVVLFDSALARIDWILLGIFSTSIATAEYSFAYKIFELSKLPLLILAPVLLTRFSKMFAKGEVLEENNIYDIRLFFKIEMVIVIVLPLLLVTCWSPLMDYFTDQKYGKVNELNFMILAICVPLHGIINFLWTLGFVQGQLRSILLITVVVSVLNIIANLIFIPRFSSEGAAASFFVCTLIQLALYITLIKHKHLKLPFIAVALALLLGIVSFVIVRQTALPVAVQTLISVSIFVTVAFVTRLLAFKQLKAAITGS